MKTTIELPDALVREMKLRAVRDGRKLKDMVAELLRRGLDAPEAPPSDRRSTYLSRDERSGLPLIRCRHAAGPGQRLTPERTADILVEQEATWHDEARR